MSEQADLIMENDHLREENSHLQRELEQVTRERDALLGACEAALRLLNYMPTTYEFDNGTTVFDACCACGGKDCNSDCAKEQTLKALRDAVAGTKEPAP